MKIFDDKCEAGGVRLLGLEILIASIAVMLLAGALAADQAWFDRHFLPIFAFPRSFMVGAERVLRGCVVLTAVLLLLIRRPIARRLGRASAGGIARVVLAVVLALGASELIAAASTAASP